MPDNHEDQVVYLKEHPYAQRYEEIRYRSNETALEVAKSSNEFIERIADVELLFTSSPKLSALIEKVGLSLTEIYEYWNHIDEAFTAVNKPEIGYKEKEVALNELKDTHSKESKKMESILATAIIALLNYLETELDDDKAKRRWPF